MPDWLQQAALTASPLSATTMAVRLIIAALFGLLIALVYRLSHGRLARDSRTLVGTLVLLTILLAMVTMVIGDSVARAFGLVGALSIVRFRTVVEDTRDTAFVIFAVVVGMAVGTGLALVAAVGVPIVAAAALAMSARATSLNGAAGVAPAVGVLRTITIRIGAGQPSGAIESLLAEKTRVSRLAGIATARQGAALDLSYSIRLNNDADAPGLVAALNTLPGVQNVDLRTTDDDD